MTKFSVVFWKTNLHLKVLVLKQTRKSSHLNASLCQLLSLVNPICVCVLGGDRLFNPASSLFHSMDPNLFITHRRIALG